MTPHDNISFYLRGRFVNHGVITDRGEWQSFTDRSQNRVMELLNVNLHFEVPEKVETWANNTGPNLPWAEDHFQERISGKPLNPGEQYKNWPWYKQGVEEHKKYGEFSHTYMERFWPRHANNPDPFECNEGVRFEYGDYNDLVILLTKRPMTRQAYLPIWFPEDLNASMNGERVPCSLGYHILSRRGSQGELTMDCWYTLRSCDFYRYLWDDIYMAGRLLQDVCSYVPKAVPGNLYANIHNLHIFADEYPRLKSEYEKEMAFRMTQAL